MSKPDWKDAPEWAQWLAQDSCGAWWWFKRKPEPQFRGHDGVWFSSCQEYAGGGNEYCTGWLGTLERRPSDRSYTADEYSEAPEGTKRMMERRALIEALRPLARVADAIENYPVTDLTKLWTVNHWGTITAGDARRARDLLLELGEWPDPSGRGHERCPYEKLARDFEGVEYRSAHPIHPRARCEWCAGLGVPDAQDLYPCRPCHGTGRQHVNGKPFYTAEEVAEFVRTERDEHDLPDYPETPCGWPGNELLPEELVQSFQRFARWLENRLRTSR